MSLVKSVFKVFDGKQKRKLFGMAFLILINSGVSLLGVSVLLPFIQAVTAPEELLANRYVAAFYEWMGMENPNELITGDSDRNCHCLSGKKCVYYFYE